MNYRNSTIDGSRGFTLLELLLAMAITAIIIVIVFGAFRVGIRAWEKGEQHIDKQQRIRVVAQLIRKQVSSISPSKTMLKMAQMVSFDGSESQMSFFSTIALDPRNRHGLVFSQFVVESGAEGADLFLVEKKLTQADAIIDVDAVDTTERVKLLSGLTAIRFHYMHHLDLEGDWDWQSEWNPDDKPDLPVAVQVQFVDAAYPSPLTVLIPLRSRGDA